MKLLDNTPLTKLLRLETQRLEQLLLDGARNGLGMPLVTPRISNAPDNSRKALFYLMVFDPLNRCHFVATDPMVMPENWHTTTLGKIRNCNLLWDELTKDLRLMASSPVSMVAEFFTKDERAVFESSLQTSIHSPNELLLADVYASQRFPEISKIIPADQDGHWQAQTTLNVAFSEQLLFGTDTDFSNLIAGFGAVDNQAGVVNGHLDRVNKKYDCYEVPLTLPGTYLGKLLFYIEKAATTTKEKPKIQKGVKSPEVVKFFEGEAVHFLAPLRMFHAMRAARYLEISRTNTTRTPEQVALAVQCMYGRTPMNKGNDDLRNLKVGIRDTTTSALTLFQVTTEQYAEKSTKIELATYEELVLWQLDIASEAQVSGSRKTHRQKLREDFQQWLNAAKSHPYFISVKDEPFCLIPTLLLINLEIKDSDCLEDTFNIKISGGTRAQPPVNCWFSTWHKYFTVEEVSELEVKIEVDVLKTRLKLDKLVLKFKNKSKIKHLKVSVTSQGGKAFKNPTLAFKFQDSASEGNMKQYFEEMGIHYSNNNKGIISMSPMRRVDEAS